MPTITIDKEDLLKCVGKKLTDETLKDRIPMIGTSLEYIDDDELVVEVFPDRPDMLAGAGFARALSAFIGINPGLRKYEVRKSDFKAKVDPKVKNVRPFVVAAVAKKVLLNEVTIQYLMQVQEKIHTTFGRNRKKLSIGVYDFDKIKFPLLYTTKPKDFKFVPLEYNKEMKLSEILSEHPKGVDYAHLLKGMKEYPIWLDANNQVLSMPPIINSENTKVSLNTKSLFIDVTGLDLNACEQALNILISSMADRGFEIYSVDVDGKSYPRLEPRKMKVNLDYVNKILGLKLKENELKPLLEKMGYGYVNSEVIVPCYRVDILSEIDIIEDIAVAYGYENFKPEISNFSSIAHEDEFESFKNKLANMMVGFGLLETNTYNLAKKNDQTKNMRLNLSLVEIENALNEEYNVLRSWMLPSLLDVFKNNKHHENPQKIFEIGTVFNSEEKSKLGMLITHSSVTYTEARQILDSLIASLGLEVSIKSSEHESFIPGRVGRIIVKGKDVGVIGEIHPEVLSNFELETPVVGFELDINELFKLIK
ncbi:phenylalanine--tRNA ligase subunit beta [Candidatus Woesearchaeota archaeon]|nr:phenylalanine--tRNA ligase subunit beta [Candidatus Woesearchaeota archaeon]